MVNSEGVPAVTSALGPVAVRAPLPRWTVPVVALLVLVVDVVVTVAMWRWVDNAVPDLDKRAAAHLDVLKLSASIAVGGGGLFALYLAARRQRTQELELEKRSEELAQRDRVQAHVELVAETNRLHAEKVQAHATQVAESNRLHAEKVAQDSREDSAARRVTDLYGKSVEQLGSDKAPVRHGGLYALERVAQDNPDNPTLRQTVVNVLCAYLRAPFDLPGDPLDASADQETRDRYRDAVQEREVRVTAQRILTAHLAPGDDSNHPMTTFWVDIDLDLTGATLIGFSLEHCHARRVRFDKASFIGLAGFDGVTFTGDAWFREATFTGDAWFSRATFTGHAWFREATFTRHARFREATFTGDAWFSRATFSERAGFSEATFTRHARFVGVTFTGDAGFDGVTFTGDAWFGEATFTEAEFDGVTFTGDAGFSEATFSGRAWFREATFSGHAWFREATFSGDARFDGVTFTGVDWFEALAAHPLSADSSWPTGWQPDPEHGPVARHKGIWHSFVRVA